MSDESLSYLGSFIVCTCSTMIRGLVTLFTYFPKTKMSIEHVLLIVLVEHPNRKHKSSFFSFFERNFEIF